MMYANNMGGGGWAISIIGTVIYCCADRRRGHLDRL